MNTHSELIETVRAALPPTDETAMYVARVKPSEIHAALNHLEELTEGQKRLTKDTYDLLVEAKRERNDLQEHLETAQRENAIFREFWGAHWAVERGVTDFDLHAEAVERLRAAQTAVAALVSNPASDQ